MYRLLLCLRYLRTRYIALACIISVMLGVATMIVVNSVMAGFASEMRDRLHNFLADIVVESRSLDGIRDSKSQMDVVEKAVGSFVEAMTPIVEVPGMITFTDPFSGEVFTSPVEILGIDPVGKAKVGPLYDYLDSYNPVIERGQIVRQALRSRDVPLSWELTDSAAARRHTIQELNALSLRRGAREQDFSPPTFDLPGGSAAETPDAAPSPQPDDSSGPVDSASETGAGEAGASDAGASDAGGAATGVIGSAETREATSETAIATDEDPFGDQFGSSPVEIQRGPLPARVYLAEGLVSFQTADPETKGLRKIMMVEPGDDIILTTVKASRPPDVVKFAATVVDSFRSGMNEYDTSIVLMNLEELQKNRGMIVAGQDAITSIHIRLKNYDDATEVVARLKAAFPPGMVHVRTWEEKQGLLLAAVEVETAILNVLLFLIIAVAGFGILAIFFMIVVEKTRDIGILKSLGASSGGVMSIFLSYGLALGFVGSSAGVLIGLLFVRYINEIEDGLSWLTGRKVFDEKIYYFFEIPTQVSPWMVFLVALGATSIAVLASVLPARRASRLHPVRALRYE